MNDSTDKHTLELCQQEHSLEKSGKALPFIDDNDV